MSQLMVLSDVDIRRALDDGEITIEPFSGKLEPASYDLRAGELAVVKSGKVKLANGDPIEIGRGESAVIYPMENISLQLKHVARFGLMSRLARQGLVLLSGPQIDPGYAGFLEVTVFNAGNSTVVICSGEPFATIEFEQLSSPASRGYNGPYQGTDRGNSTIIKLIKSSRRTFAEFEDKFKDLETKYDNINRVVLYAVFGVVTAVALAAAKSSMDYFSDVLSHVFK